MIARLPAVRSSPTLAIALLSLTTAGVGAFAWRQHQELERLRGEVARQSEQNREQKQKLEVAERRTTAAERERGENPAPMPRADESPPAGAESGSSDVRGFGSGRRSERMAALMEDPEMQRLMLLRHKGVLDGRYAELFKRLNLSPAQLEQLKNLLAERQLSMRDAFSAARSEGLSPRENPDAFRQLMASTRDSVEQSIRSQLGETVYAELQQFETTEPQRRSVAQLQQRLSYSSTPLTTAQSDQLVRLLASSGAGLSEASIAQARGVLSGPQIQALEQLRLEQQAQQQINETLRNRFAPDGAPAAPAGAAPGSG